MDPRSSFTEEARASATSFHYQALPQPVQEPNMHAFRLLRLLPGCLTDPIYCTLRNHYIYEAPEYEALSYCWGDQDIKYPVTCNSAEFLVTRNVHDALVALRHTTLPRILWIDQICIDQENLLERSYQVGVMRFIYQNAVGTVIWLGPATPDTQRTITFIQYLTTIHRRMNADNDLYNFVPVTHHLLRQYELQHNRSKKGIDMLVALLKNPWFERIWVLQEVIVSKRAKIIQGNSEVLWDEFAVAISTIWRLQLGSSSFVIVRGILQNVLHIQSLRKSFSIGGRVELKKLALLFHGSKSTDPRDKLYALVGISSDADANTKMLSYSCSVSDAFHRWTIHTLYQDNSLEILRAVNKYKSHRSKMDCSWVPDWDIVSDSQELVHSPGWPSFQFHASNSPNTKITFRDDQRVLGVSGHFVDRVEAVGMLMYAKTDEKILGSRDLAIIYKFEKILRSWEDTARINIHRSYKPTGQAMFEAYWQTLCFGNFQTETENLVRSDFETFEKDLRKPFRYIDCLQSRLLVYVWALAVLIILMIYVCRKYREHSLINGPGFTSCSAEMGHRRMIRTETGYIGLAVHAARVGDRVCLMRGSQLPLLVRGDRSDLRLVGDCYIHGIMYGERWSEDLCEPLWLH